MNTTLGRIRSAFSSLPARATLVLLTFVSIGIVVMGCVGYLKLDEATRDNAEVRIDRAARAAAAITAGTFAGMFVIERDDTGTPLAIHLSPGLDAAILKTSPKFDSLVEEIAATNQGSANVFCLNRETMLFDRFATTLRNPDGSLARNASLGEAHAAYASLLAGRHYTGEVRVLDRFRLAYLTPMLDSGGTVVGALAVDVGWVDDLVRARTELQSDILISTGLLLFVVTTIGAYLLYRAFRPLRAIGAFAHRVAIGEVDADVPYLGRKDEIGTLAAGMAQVVSMQNKLEQLAYYDQLTGVFNRSRFLRSLDAIFEAREPLSAALLVVDIDGFRGVNEAFGHAAGDALVAQVAAALKAELRPGETLSRIGGNEFAIVTEGRTGAGDVEALAAAVLQRMARPFRLPQAEVQTGCSIGIVLLPANARSTQDAIRNAELALNQAKTGGRGRYCFFTDEMSEAASNRAVTTRALREAIDADELTLHFQPQIRSADFGLFGVEALARWHHATRGDIPPAEFIPIAEESGLIIDLGKVVLNHSCRVARQWLDDGFDFQRISVNVSPTQIRQSDFRAVVVAALEAANLPALSLPGGHRKRFRQSWRSDGPAHRRGAARTRRFPVARRFRNGLFLPRLSQPAALQPAQDRPKLRHRYRQRRAEEEPAQRHGRPRQGPRHADRRRGCRNRGRGGGPLRRRLRRHPGLLLLPAGARRVPAGRGRAGERNGADRICEERHPPRRILNRKLRRHRHRLRGPTPSCANRTEDQAALAFRPSREKSEHTLPPPSVLAS